MKQAAKLETQLIDFREGDEEEEGRGGREGTVEVEEISSFVCSVCPHILMELTGERCRKVIKWFLFFLLLVSTFFGIKC